MRHRRRGGKGVTYEEIGREFGGRHHTTVLHSIRRVEETRSSDKALNSTITRLVDAYAS